MNLVIWRPNPGQQEYALTREENEVLYGGARGGGKTDASIAWISRWVDNPDLRFLVIRRNAADLDDWIARAKKMWTNAGLQPVFAGREVRFPSGAVGRFGHLFDDNAYERYQGHEYQKMIIEELTHIPTEDLFLKLIGSCRSTVDGLHAQIFMTTNPGNIGHEWVKRRYVDVSEPNETYVERLPSGIRTRIFIPAKVEDNPVLVEKDPQYVAYLDSLKGPQKQAWRDGSWDSFEVKGAYYTKWIQNAEQEKRIGRVPHLPELPVHTWWDLGMGDAMSIGFFQIVSQHEWHWIDYYESEGEGIQHYIAMLNDKRRELGYDYGEHYAPHDIEVRELTRDGKTRREVAKSLGIDFSVVPKHYVADGIQAVRTRFGTLWIDKERCAEAVNHIKNYRKKYDEKHDVYLNKPVHDKSSHAADMLRYWAMTPFTTKSKLKIGIHR